jgi:sterol desaturase/sphingolipid hydroxylase (fatty acid hydroxylase superfamily)
MPEWLVNNFYNKTSVVAAVLILLLVLERLFPAVVLRENIARLGRNFSLVTLNAVISPFIIVPLSLLASSHAVAWRPDWATGVIIDLLLLDCWIYFWHRANHVIPFLWRFHEVHHLDERLDATSALRFHFGEVALSAVVRAAVIFCLAVPLKTIFIFETLVTVAALFHHSNLKLPQWLERPLSIFIVTPSLHFVHHHAVRKDTDSNYSTVLSIWDRLFSSRSATERSLSFKMGVEGESEVSLLRLILRPFYRA